MAAVAAARDTPSHARPGVAEDLWWSAGSVAVGSVLIVVAAINQPYNQNELQQIAPYGSNSLHEITTGTRQPPLDPLLGALVQHVLGEGQLRQRLVPVLAGIGTLVVFSLLMRRLGLGRAGAFGVLMLSTAPLMVRYAAYTRPYATPMFLMMLFAYGAQAWLDDRRPRWLVLAALAAVALPLTRVPEPTVFLSTAAVTLAWFARTGRRSWSQVWPLLAISLGALVFVGYPMYRSLASQTSGVFDTSPGGIISRFGTGVYEFGTAFLPLLGGWFPWWPVTTLIVVTAFAWPVSRRRLTESWFWWPFLLAPLVFALAFHFLNPYSLDARPYRSRYAYFFLPGFVLLVVTLADLLREHRPASPRLRLAVSVLLGVTLLGQLPATAAVLRDNEAADFEQVADVLTHDVPAAAIVLYDSPGPAGKWRQPFSAKPRYMGSTPYTAEVGKLARNPQWVTHRGGPVYLLILDGQCASSVECDLSAPEWDPDVPGWQVGSRFDHFTLYEPTRGQSGRRGVAQALEALAQAFGPDLGAVDTFAAAVFLKREGHPGKGKALIRHMYARVDAERATRIREYASKYELNPFE